MSSASRLFGELMSSASRLFEPRIEVRLEFDALGTPRPKGSMRAFPFKRRDGTLGVNVTNDNTETRAWQEAVQKEAFVTRGHQEPISEGPIVLEVFFFLPRPKSTPQRVIVPCVSKDDIDKLLRSVMDAITQSGAWRDDGQVTDVNMVKRFAGGWGDPLGDRGVPRAVVRIGRLL